MYDNVLLPPFDYILCTFANDLWNIFHKSAGFGSMITIYGPYTFLGTIVIAVTSSIE